jgi:hypothetical protein
MSDDFVLGAQRRRIEDAIVDRFRGVTFDQKAHTYLEDERFWDFVFSWYELVRYYEESGDNTIGAHMLELFAECSTLFRRAASDARLTERRRDKAADALYQMTYYVNQLAAQVRRNGLERENTAGAIAWKPDDDISSLN